MSQSLYLFNPNHDLALANGDENFNSPQSALAFAKDLACFPMWYAETGSCVLGAMPYRDWFEEMKTLFPQLNPTTVTSKPDLTNISSVKPWGWNSAAVKSLALRGVDSSLLPTPVQIGRYRALSHRETSIRAMNVLQNESSLRELIALPARLITTEEVAGFASNHSKSIFKAPWSSSGKGLCWANGKATDAIVGWCRNVVEKQGAVVAEEAYDKVQDFAMEFLCMEGKVTFAGYSLFETERGVYKSNALMSDANILDRLTKNFLSLELIVSVQQCLVEFITQEIAPHYSGYLGVDMFVYQENDRFKLHPCVEINLRMTMGMAARIFYDRFVSPGSVGSFYIDHFAEIGELLANHQQKCVEMPLEVSNGSIISGYLSLSPISKNSHYRARVEVD